MFPIHKPDSAELKGAFRREGNAEPSESGDTLGQDALSAGLVDRWNPGVQNRNLQVESARRDRRDDARWSRSDNDDLASFSHN
jgi:hypothetical protein